MYPNVLKLVSLYFFPFTMFVEEEKVNCNSLDLFEIPNGMECQIDFGLQCQQSFVKTNCSRQ